MRWEDGRRSRNVEDRRGMPVRRGGIVGGGIGTILVVLALSYFLGVDPRLVLQAVPQAGGPAPAERGPPLAPDADIRADFVSVVLADTEDTWAAIFSQWGQDYEPPRLVLFNKAVESACGLGQSAMGPFYCPADRQVYIDLAFYDDLKQRFNAPGDFAQAYVIAHEVGHHVQNLRGTAERIQAMREAATSEADANALSVRLELQADCYAGVWAAQADEARGILEAGDVEEGLAAASAIGDDRLQRQATGTLTPDSFTHGSSEQRVRWFRRGLDSGDPDQCRTFEVSDL